MTQVLAAAHGLLVEATFRPRCAPAGDPVFGDPEDGALWDPTPPLGVRAGECPHGELTEYGTEVFTAGDCWALAWHAWRQLRQYRPDLDARLCVVGVWPGWTHVLVETDTGLFLDATGICTYDDLAAVWGPEPISHLPAEVTTDLLTYRRALGGTFEPYDFVYPITHGQTAEIADLLIKTHLRLSAPVERMTA